jgi:copper(I)-binding protein
VLAGLAGLTGLTGCARPAVAVTAPIKLASAYVIRPTGPGIIDGYLIISNPGPADRLLAVSSSAGGQVALSSPAEPGAQARTVGALPIPAHSVVRMDPTTIHIVITHSGPMQPGTEVTLTLRFARAGVMRVTAQVMNLQSDGSGGYQGS